MAEIFVDFSKAVGKMKPVHGIGQPPITNKNTLFPFLQDAGIPYSRLHDVGGYFGGGRFVDVPNIFRDFDADENDPTNYDFTFTDILISGLIENGVEPFFRLGVTIEETEVKPYYVYPPKDFHKWARICEHIIMHYTEGWADGFFHKITYWEIWNEPDNAPDTPESIIHNHMWQGTKEEYYEFYTVVSKHLKDKFPHLKIGGYGSCGFYTLHNGQVPLRDISNASPRHEYFITFFEGFLEHIRKENAPLDFFTWHNYRGYKGVSVYADYARQMLDAYGYAHAESICDEWCNIDFRLGRQADCAAKTMLEIIAYQNACVDAAMAYDGRVSSVAYSMLFSPETLRPRPSYFAFKSFNRLYQLKTQVLATSDDSELTVLAASDGQRGGMIIVNCGYASKPLVFGENLKFNRCYVTEDYLTDFEMERLPKEIAASSFVTVLCEK